jgi:hypothetical protein
LPVRPLNHLGSALSAFGFLALGFFLRLSDLVFNLNFSCRSKMKTSVGVTLNLLHACRLACQTSDGAFGFCFDTAHFLDYVDERFFGDVEFSGLGLRSDRKMFNFGGTQHASSKFYPQTERVRAEMVERQWSLSRSRDRCFTFPVSSLTASEIAVPAVAVCSFEVYWISDR